MLPAPDPAAHEYPRPQLRRPRWTSLNGSWEFALDSKRRWHDAADVDWTRQIVVPFSPETAASGIGDQAFHEACWYRREFDAPALEPGERLFLHFGAVDFMATVWVNGAVAASHMGGYTPFSADITALLVDGPQSVVVHAVDDPSDLEKPRGKQDWMAEPHLIFYPRTTGIWQTVWLEVVPATRIARLLWRSNLERWEIELEAWIGGEQRGPLSLDVVLSAGGKVLVDDTYSVTASEVHRRIALSDPGIDDYRNELLWSPESPTLIDARLELRDAAGELLDAIESYAALREVTVEGGTFLLNHRPYELRLVLDQGYWPETGLTAPADEAFRLDIDLVKRMGFNGVRKHQKIEDPRFLYWADRLGLLVWEEMPSAYRFTRRSIERVLREWGAVLDRDMSHPCIVTWVPFNESSGVPDISITDAQRRYVESLYHLTRSIDQSRPIVGNDGWENVTTDIVGIHDYDPHEVLAARYESEEVVPKLFARQRYEGRRLLISEAPYAGQPIILSEFGGLLYPPDAKGPESYVRVETAEAFADEYVKLLGAVRKIAFLAGFCYTQLADTYQETNGLVYADRRSKIPLETVAGATAGPRYRHEARAT